VVSAVHTCRHLRSAGQGDLVVPRTNTAGFGSTKLFSHWSIGVEQSAAGNEDDITDTRTVLCPAWTVLCPAENWKLYVQLHTRECSRHNVYCGLSTPGNKVAENSNKLIVAEAIVAEDGNIVRNALLPFLSPVWTGLYKTAWNINSVSELNWTEA